VGRRLEPLNLVKAQLDLDQAKANLEKLQLEVAAAKTVPPELARKIKEAELALRQAQTNQANALAEYQRAHAALARAQAGQVGGRQHVGTRRIEVGNRQGTISLVVVNGVPYQIMYLAPRFSDVASARKAIEEEVK